MNKHDHIADEAWLCRNCNSLNAAEAAECVYCHADRPEESASHREEQEHADQTATTTETAVRRDDYSNPKTAAPAKYTFRESVLVTAADIILFIGLFGTLGALIAPRFIEGDAADLRLYSIVGAIVLFAWGMISWALLRCVADISRRMREQDN